MNLDPTTRISPQTAATRGHSYRGFAIATLSFGLAIAPCMWFADSALSNALSHLALPGDIERILDISEVFAHGSGVIAILLTLWWVDIERRPLLLVAASMTLVSSLVANALKFIFSRARPYSADIVDGMESWLPMFHGSFWDAAHRSFPSGHAATATGLAIGLSLVYPRGKVFFVIFAILACLQRIASQAHYPSDVLAGITIALACSTLLANVMLKTR